MLKMKKKYSKEESILQQNIMRFSALKKIKFANNIYSLSDFLIAIPNGGSRNFFEAAKLKKEGVKSGVSDLFFALPPGLWIEVKSEKGRMTENQKKWFQQCELVGYKTALVRSLHDFEKAVNNYFIFRNEENYD